MERFLRCRFPERAARAATVVTVALSTVGVRDARAQACCAGAGTLAPVRLAEEERWAAALVLRGSSQLGQWDGEGRWTGSPEGSAELGMEQQLAIALRWAPGWQGSLLLPWVETWRRVPGLSDAGTGLGDVRLGVRWDLVAPGEWEGLPGAALLMGASLPTGRSAEQARQPLGADGTGLGTTTVQAGLALEQTHGHLLWQASGQAQYSADRAIGPLRVSFGPQLLAQAALGWAFDSSAGLALTASVRHDLPSSADGAEVAGSGRTLTSVGLAAGLPLARGWRLQASLGAPVAADGWARSSLGLASFGVSLLALGY